MTVFTKRFTRDFPVLLGQIWGRRYRRIFGETIKTVPRSVYIYENGLLTTYRSPMVNREINSVLLPKLAGNSHFIEKYLATFQPKIKTIQELCSTPIKNRKKFKKLIRLIFDSWQAHYISVYIPLDDRFSEAVHGEAVQFRKENDQLEYKSFDHLSSSLFSLYGGPLARYIYLDEILKNNIPSTAVLKKRSKQKIHCFDDKIITEGKFHELEKQHDFTLEKEDNVSTTSEIKGHIACRGKVRGMVRILLRNENVVSFPKGAVLVTSMTVPTFLPAMAKAAAFVTDEGGITCHAAIISRELGKPCIIGTKIATKVLKDGDMVKVDAERGIVTILERGPEQR